MKSVMSWLLLLVIYVAYLVIGGFIFHYTECPKELDSARQQFEEDTKLNLAILDLREKLNDSDVLETVINKISENHVISNEFSDSFEDNRNLTKCKKWDYENSLFFAFTVVTTIGYGHQFTTTPGGRMSCLAYALIGIPLNAILIGSLGSVFSNRFKQYKKKLWQGFGQGDDAEDRPRVVVVLVESIVFIFFFTSVLMLIPAAIFTALENDESGSWDYHNSIYYTFITLSTVGFGDMVPDRQENKNLHNQASRWSYLIGIILWIIIGMGYIFAVVDVLAETFRSTSKPMKKAWRGLKNQMFVNDYWKKIINEIILLKESDIKIDDSAILVGGGGSEPCLGAADAPLDEAGDDLYNVRRVVSAGNIQDQLDNSFQLELDTHTANRKVSKSNLELVIKENCGRVSENFLTVPGGHRRTRAGSPSSDESLDEEVNDDTITSLRQFITVAKIGQPGLSTTAEWAENNLPGLWLGGRGDSVDNVGGAKQAISRTTSLTTRPERRPSVRSNVSRKSTRSAMSGPVGALLESTTLGEFLTAVENVRKKSELELADLELAEEGVRRRPSFLERIVIGSRRSSEGSRRGSTSTASTTAHLAMVTAAGEIIQAASHSEPPSANHI